MAWHLHHPVVKVAFFSSELRRLIKFFQHFADALSHRVTSLALFMLSLPETLLPGNSLFNKGVSKQGPGFPVSWPLTGFPVSW